MPKLAELEKRLLRVEEELAAMRSLIQPAHLVNPWAEMQGTLLDEELTAEWRDEMAVYRRQKDAAPIVTTLQELEQFTQFVGSKLRANKDGMTLEECLTLWRRQRQEDEATADVQQSVADCQAGRLRSLEDAFDSVQNRLENSR